MFLKKENTIRQTQQGPLSTEDAGAQKTEHVHLEDSEKDVGVVSQTAQNYIPAEDEYNVTFKTWIVVCVLSLSYGVSIWPLPTVSTIQTDIATQLGNPANAAWFIPVYTISLTIAFMLCGANSDLFGRRWFIAGGNLFLLVGYVVVGSAKTTGAVITGLALQGFGAGNAQLAAFSLPELLPNKWRHIAVVIADAGVYLSLIVGPVAGRFAIRRGDDWRWLLYGPAIITFVSFCLLVWLYFPPKHPRGILWNQALRELDYIGMVLFVAGTVLILTGIVYTTTVPSSDPKVIATLASGFGVMVIFALWETFAPLKQPLTPTRVFTRNKGRDLTAPFIALFVATMYYFALNILWPTMISTWFTNETTDFKYSIILTLPQNLGVAFGALLLSFFGSKIGHWKWTLTASLTLAVIFGAALAATSPDRKGMAIAFIFLAETSFSWALYLSTAFCQFGVDQVELGIAGGLGGVARFAGGSIATSVYTTILSNTQRSKAKSIVPLAATAVGLPALSVPALLQALPLGSLAIMAVPGVNATIAAAAGAAFQQSYVHAVRITALSSLSFGCVGILACLCNVDIGKKMDNKIEVFLENDENAAKNRFH